MNTVPVTVLIAVKNEAANIAKCLKSLSRAERVVVIDSQSTDSTPEIARENGAEVLQFQYSGGYPKKRQWALNTCEFTTEWILLLDADEEVPPALWDEIANAISNPHANDAYLITKGFHFLGRRFRFGGFSFAAVLLIKRGKARFEELVFDDAKALDMEVHERVIVDGTVGRFKTPLIHDDFKGLEAYLDRHNKYSTWEAKLRHRFLTTGRYGSSSVKPRLFGNAQERRRFLKYMAVRVPFEPWLWFMYHFFFKLGFLDGRRGLIASRFRADYIAGVRAKVYELRTIGKRSAIT
jgi:glycosyltransferase involved in cell wall biosynthesis